MYLTKKIRLLPTKEQEILFWKSVGVARWSYNYFLSESYRVYQEWLNDNSKPRYISEGDVRKYINNHVSTYTRPLGECKNIQKQKGIIQKLYRRLLNIRTNYLHQTTTEIVKIKPSQIVLEDLNVSGMMKNRHLSKALMCQKLYEFRRQIEYKAELYGIGVVIADRFYPSSKTCHKCGHIKKDLKLSDRTYKCSECGNIVDRDVNASINLARYKI